MFLEIRSEKWVSEINTLQDRNIPAWWGMFKWGSNPNSSNENSQEARNIFGTQRKSSQDFCAEVMNKVETQLIGSQIFAFPRYFITNFAIFLNW